MPRRRLPGVIGVLAVAAWARQGSAQLPVCTGPGAPSQVAVAAGDSFAVITWRDDRDPAKGFDVYAQALNAFGNPLWGPYGRGTPICSTATHQEEPAVAVGPDGLTTIVWRDARDCGGLPKARIFQQSLAQSGSRLCTANGSVVLDDCRNLGSHHPSVFYAEPGVSTITWNYRTPVGFGFHDSRIRSQKQGSGCAGIWSADAWSAPWTGTPDIVPLAISDAAGGVISAWADPEPCAPFVYARRINSGGTPLWSDQITICSNVQPDPVRVCTDNSVIQRNPRVAPDGAGGIIVAWEHGPDGARSIRAQRIDASGARQWGTCGKVVATTAGDLRRPLIVRSTSGRSFIVWEDATTPTQSNLYAQRINLLGDTLATRIPICTAPQAQTNHVVVAGATGACIIAWEDQRDIGSGDLGDIYTQRLDAAGTVACTQDGVLLPAPIETRQSEPRLARMHSQFGQTLLVWTDDRNVSPDLYAWLLADTCNLIVLDAQERRPGAVALRGNHPNPFHRSTDIHFSLATEAAIELTIHDIAGRRVRTLLSAKSMGPGEHHVRWDGLSDLGSPTTAGVYFYSLNVGGVRHTRQMVLIE